LLLESEKIVAQVTGGEPLAGDDLDRVAFFNLSDLPPLAFPTDRVVTDRLRVNNGKE